MTRHYHHRYGWIKDDYDPRDRKFSVVRPRAAAPLPPVVDLRQMMPPVDDQGNIGACVAHSITGAAGYLQIKSGKPFQHLSRLFLYYNTRVDEDSVAEDDGVQIRDAIKSFAGLGLCEESLWPYVESQFATKPPGPCYEDATTRQITSYTRLDNTDINQLHQCLADGYPFVFGVSVYDSFESETVAGCGIVPMPGPGEHSCGAHAMCCVGIDAPRNHFIVRNSWGTDWGNRGYCYVPIGYMTSVLLASDFWTIRAEEDVNVSV